MNVALIGFGMVAERFHAPLLSVEPGLKWTHVVERSRRRAEQLYPGIVTVTSAQELWSAPVDVVVILTPNDTHFALAKEALEAGKHVVVDKPFTVSSAQADELIELSQRVGRVLTVFQNRRWDGDFLTLRKLIDEGTLGTLHRYESRWERFRPQQKGGWREEEGEGNGILYDLGSHMIDQALLLFGRPKAVFAHLETQRPGASAVDSFLWIGDYGRFQVHLSSNCLTAAPSFRYQVMGDAGSFTKSGIDQQEDALQAGIVPGSDGWGDEASASWGKAVRLVGDELVEETVPTLAGDYPSFYRNLAATLRGQAKLAVEPEQARDVVRGIELAQESATKGGWVWWL